MWVLVIVAMGLAVVSLLVQWRFMPHRAPPAPGPPLGRILRDMHPALRRLLLAEVFTRIGEWMTREFIVLYLVLAQGLTTEAAGLLIALQNFTALLTYLPIGRTTTKVGLRPFVGLSFVFFALTPLALVLCPSPWWLPVAFVIAGLREVGEPARKAMVTSLFPEEVRARGVGLYWGLRSFAYAPAGLAGAALWWGLGPQGLLWVAFAVGAVGAVLYYGMVGTAAPVSDPGERNGFRFAEPAPSETVSNPRNVNTPAPPLQG
jgi:predicted MFS family arabinose efflux permease